MRHTMEMLTDARAVVRRVERVRERIEQACRRAGRRPEEVTLVAVSKTFPLAAVDAARAAGVRHFGESKVQELAEKAAFRAGHQAGGEIAWHMIGHLQRNKARDVAETADVFHALDSLALADELEARLADAGRTLPCFVQVNVAREPTKYGFDPDALPDALDHIAACRHLDVRGLMAMAPYSDDPEHARPHFARLRQLAAEQRVTLDELSMGMSGDFEVAVEEGATLVRVGSALFGERDYS